MKLLLTSNGLSNDSIAHAFADLIGKNPSDTKVAFITTIAEAERANKDWLINDLHRLKRYGYDVDVIDIAVLAPADIIATVNAADAIFVGGGNSFQMSYWLQQSGLFELLPQLLKTKVYAGISAGSMLASHSLRLSSQALKQQGRLRDEDYNKLGPSGESSAKTLQFVDFEFRPHLDSTEYYDIRNEAYIRQAATNFSAPIYALDNQSALKIVDGNTEVISEGKWLLLNSDS